MSLRLYNTLTQRLDEFAPAAPPDVSMYICGATVYAPAHIGHGRSYIVFDVLRRVLEFLGYRVRHVQNFTDVAEEIVLRARETGDDPAALADRLITAFLSDMDRLHVLRAQMYPRVSESVTGIVRSVEHLVNTGYAYAANGSVYFDAQRAGGFGALSHQDLSAMVAGGMGGVGARRHLLDFALWKTAKPTELAWESPWGRGRPGWHIECTVMSGALLPRPLDIHGGGVDLIYPHHESEMLIARAETGVDLARFYVHNALVTHRLEKMSKSRANYVTLTEVFEEYDPSVVRYALLAYHYRAAMECCDEGFDDATHAVASLTRSAAALAGDASPRERVRATDGAPSAPRMAVRAAIEDDLDTPRALDLISGLAADAAASSDSAMRRDVATALQDAAWLLGLPFLDPHTAARLV